MADSFSFELVSPERLLVSEKVTAVLAPATGGYMTVMANHAPLMASLRPGIVVATLGNGTQRRFFVRGGFADISPDGFTLLAEHATAVEDLDPAILDQSIRDTEEEIAGAKDDDLRQRAAERLADLQNARTALGS